MGYIKSPYSQVILQWDTTMAFRAKLYPNVPKDALPMDLTYKKIMINGHHDKEILLYSTTDFKYNAREPICIVVS